jgi:hypothetical protein
MELLPSEGAQSKMLDAKEKTQDAQKSYTNINSIFHFSGLIFMAHASVFLDWKHRLSDKNYDLSGVLFHCPSEWWCPIDRWKIVTLVFVPNL